ncbi:MAG TPA: type 4a pilus biogenesis protein PilO [Gaiellaceae bacterium]|nr:type 4a pilus biogenesis protein PilO [Gaiellaceae bacterium]
MSALTRSRPALVALVATANLVLAGAGWLLVVSPQRHHAAERAHAVEAAQAQIEQLRAAARTPGATPRQEPIRTADLYRLAKAMPSDADQPDLLLQVDQIARAAGVTVLTIQPGTPTAASGYTVLPVSLTFSGDFFGLTDLLYRLRSLVSVRHGALDATGRLFSVSEIQLDPSGTGRDLTAQVTVNAFTFGTDAAVTGAATTAATTTDTTSTATTGDTTTTSGE